ncbi:dTDP-4-dehydrorhamnose 3,5-epimerase family protein [Desulforamulus ruminis]|uniref:dTDP-4-dehydrorhamnose 3,5-epimerase n=1 Tax=Desulforamulus ruminis (strain ATCC 23193 / DSM 2154 / NCIMB 8452 / DL) TaxID=696281 RepID=F6DM55_DESRL|nr:dTDP-4-dehydrorhamnose 3,5-epimerase family protein [Desulforamulus ruminis]AEG59397.1 dTDP-4-dehydrorhamnose 3,5-epimerase [Desulforamulus ruminis DSM 2154]
MLLIKDVLTKKLQVIPDDRGYLMEMLRADWPEFMNFSQAYVTACYPHIIKAWHYHQKQWDHFVCLSGMAKVVLYDDREGSPTRGTVNVFHLGNLNPLLLRIPPLVYHGFTTAGNQPALIVNFPTELYNYQEPDEHRLPYNTPGIPYDWEVKHG